MRVSLGPQLDLRFGAASRSGVNLDTGLALSPLPGALLASTVDNFSAQSVSAGLEWRLTNWAGIAVNASQTSERGTVLGRAIAGPIAVSNGAGTASFGVSARVGFGDGWVTTLAFDQGVTHLDLKPSMLMPNPNAQDAISTQSYGVAVTKEHIFGDDMFGFSLSRPVQSNGLTFGDSRSARVRAFRCRRWPAATPHPKPTCSSATSPPSSTAASRSRRTPAIR